MQSNETESWNVRSLDKKRSSNKNTDREDRSLVVAEHVTQVITSDHHHE